MVGRKNGEFEKNWATCPLGRSLDIEIYSAPYQLAGARHALWRICILKRRQMDQICWSEGNVKDVRLVRGVAWEDVDIGTVLPHLGSLLTVPPPRDHVLARLQVVGDDQLVGDHAQGPVPAAPAFVPVVVWRMELGGHMG